MEGPSPCEPAAITLADLLALVAGVALVLTALDWSDWLDPANFQGRGPRWLSWLRVIDHFLAMVCQALIPVVLARRFRYGGLARPAEFLAACCGLPLLGLGVDNLLFRAWVRLGTGHVINGPGLSVEHVISYSDWRQGPYWTWKYSVLAAAALAVVAFLLGRRRLPGWLLTALLLIAWLGTFHAGPELIWRCVIRPILHRVPSSVSDYSDNLIPSIISALTSQPLRFLLFAVPALIALRELRRPRLHRRTWLEWTGLVLAAILLPVVEAIEHVRAYFDYPVFGIWVRDMVFRDLAMLAVIALCIPIAKRLGPAWSHRDTTRYNDTIGETGSTVL